MSKIVQKALHSFLSTHPIAVGDVVAVGVSGGADSLCLVLALADIARERGFRVHALTVDHQLRPESAQEADAVAQLMKKNKIPHTTLVWKGAKPVTRIEEVARDKRYHLMFDWCRQNAVTHLFIAHHIGDQAETFWARLARGSGVDGLSAIAPMRLQDDIRLCRPLLSVPKKDIQTFLLSRGVSWVEDSMNRDVFYERVRWRERQGAFSQIGLTPDVIGRTVDRLQRAREALDFYTDRFYEALVTLTPMGYGIVPVASFRALPAEIRIRVLRRILSYVGGDDMVPLETVERYITTFPTRATLGGCLLIRKKDDLFIAREAARMDSAADIPACQEMQWDRFCVWASYPVRISAGTSDYPELPHAVRQSIPHISADEPVRVYFGQSHQKGLEKKNSLDYNKGKEYPVYIRMTNSKKDKK